MPFSFAACVAPLVLVKPFAGVAVHSTPVATTVQHVLWRGCLGVVGSLWSRQPHAFVVQVVTTNSRIQDMDIVAPNQLDECRIEVLANSLLLFHGAQVAGTRWSLHCGGMEPHDLDVLTSMARLWRLPVKGRSSVTQSSLGNRGERDWLSWRPKCEEGGHRRLRTFCSN